MLDWVLNTSLSVALSLVKKSNKFSDMQQTSHTVLNPNLVGVGEAGGGGEGNFTISPSWFALNNSKTVKVVTLEFWSIQ